MEIFTTYNIIIGILVALLIILSYIIRNLLVKTEKYEDVTQEQVRELQENRWVQGGAWL